MSAPGFLPVLDIKRDIMARSAVLDALRTLVGADYLLTDADSLHHYGRDWTRAWTPAPAAVVLPSSVEEVQAIVALANRLDFALVPSGGRTGLSGGAVAQQGEVVLALDRMNRIIDFDPVDRQVTVQAGVITAQLQDYAAEKGLFYPVDFASAGSSQIGGNIATNAGGIKVIRYGMTRDWVAGLKVVTGQGDVLEFNRGLLKNNTGYDLRHLMVGSEGTLGIIVEATLQLTRPPQAQTVMVLGVTGLGALMSILHAFQYRLDLTAFEFFSELALSKVVAHTGLQRPFADPAPYYALLEFECADGADTDNTAMALFEHCVAEGWVVDGVISQSLEQQANLWRLREDISETIARWTPYKNDIATRISRIPSLLSEVEALVNAQYPDFEVVWFGHIGDGNVHLNILKPDDLAAEVFFDQCHVLSRGVFEIVQRHGGSVSAEHGVGLLKRDHLGYSRSPTDIALMRGIKAVFDPRGVLNPGKIFPD